MGWIKRWRRAKALQAAQRAEEQEQAAALRRIADQAAAGTP